MMDGTLHGGADKRVAAEDADTWDSIWCSLLEDMRLLCDDLDVLLATHGTSTRLTEGTSTVFLPVHTSEVANDIAELATRLRSHVDSLSDFVRYSEHVGFLAEGTSPDRPAPRWE